MSIAVADIKSRVVQITKRNTSDVTDEIILEACNEIALRTGILKGSASGTISSGTNTATAPTDMLSDTSVETFYLGTDILDPISFEEWREGKKRGYCVCNGTIYVTPTPNNDKSYTIYYDKTHGALSTNLEFPDIYQPAVVQLVAAKVYEDFEIEDKAEYRQGKYENELIKLPSPQPTIAHGRRSN